MLTFLRWYADERLNPRIMDERRCLPPSLVMEFGSAGLLGLQVGEEHRGQALSHRDTLRVMTQLGAIDANLAILVAVHNTLGIPPIEKFAAASVKAEVLPQLATGSCLVTSAISEPGMGSHLRALATRATRSADGGYLINGSKCWISLGGWARYCNVFAQLHDGEGRPAGVSGFLVESRSPGFKVGPEVLTLGMKTFPQNDLTLSNLRVPPESLLGAEGDGLRVAKTAFMAGRVVLAASSLGGAKRALQIAARFATRRPVATGQLIDNGRTQQILADCVAAVRAVETLVSHIGGRLDVGASVPSPLYFTAKALGCELMWRVVDRCVQLLGARGYLDTNVVGQHFRDYRLFRIFEGATEAVTVYLGSTILGAPHEFFTTIDNEFDASPEVDELRGAVAELTATAVSGARQRHVLANVLGELAGWTIMAAATSAAARGTGSAMDLRTAAWCAHRLRRRLRAAEHDLRSAAELPTVEELTKHIAGFEATIGDVEHALPGEHYALDPLLRRG